MNWLKIFYYRHIRHWFVNDNIVKPRWLTRKDCVDCDTLLEQCCFEILARFIEQELIPLRTYKGQKPEYCKEEKQLLAIYHWWKNDYLVKQKRELDDLWKYIDDKFNPQHIFKDDPDNKYLSIMELVVNEGTTKENYYKVMDEHRVLKEYYTNMLTKNLHRLINLRGDMWS